VTDIKLTYVENSKGKYDFKVVQDGDLIYEKTYSPVKSQNQHLMAKALVETFQQVVDETLSQNPDFRWKSFEEFKSWARNSETRSRAVDYYHKQQLNIYEGEEK